VAKGYDQGRTPYNVLTVLSNS